MCYLNVRLATRGVNVGGGTRVVPTRGVGGGGTRVVPTLGGKVGAGGGTGVGGPKYSGVCGVAFLDSPNRKYRPSGLSDPDEINLFQKLGLPAWILPMSCDGICPGLK